MMFPLAGSERRGLVFLEATKLRVNIKYNEISIKY